MLPIIGNCMECGVRIPDTKYDVWLFTITGMCGGCTDEIFHTDYKEMEVYRGINCERGFRCSRCS
jgi:hypothetical protein